MTTPLRDYQALYNTTSRLLKSYSQVDDTSRLYFGILCKNFVTLTLPSGSGSLADADTYSDSGNKNSSFYVAELAKLVTLSHNIFLNEVVINPSECSFYVNNNEIDPTGEGVTIGWFPNPLYQSYKICLQINKASYHGINTDPVTTTEIGFGSNNQYIGFDKEIPVGNVTTRDLVTNGDLVDFSDIGKIHVYIFGYTDVGQTGTRSNVPSIIGSIIAGDNKMYFDKSSNILNGCTMFAFNISRQVDYLTGNEQTPLGFIGGN